MDKLSDAPLGSMDAPTQREPKMGKVYIGTKVIRAEVFVYIRLMKK